MRGRKRTGSAVPAGKFIVRDLEVEVIMLFLVSLVLPFVVFTALIHEIIGLVKAIGIKRKGPIL